MGRISRSAPAGARGLTARLVGRTAHSPATLQLSGRATFHDALELRRSLLAALDATGDELLIVDLSGVDRMDTASLAVLVEGLIRTRKGSTEILLCGPSDQVRAVFHLAGLDDALGRCVTCREEAMARMAAPQRELSEGSR